MGLKVFNLQCSAGHLFEGWFGSHEDYDSQKARGLIECPICQTSSIEKMPSAPRINKGRHTSAVENTTATSDSSVVLAGASQEIAKMQAQILQQFREFVNKTEDVGVQFANEARRIHDGESENRPIRGVATQQERQELAEEGIAVVALPDFLANDQLN